MTESRREILENSTTYFEYRRITATPLRIKAENWGRDTAE
jgi:hypothetical protein